MPALEQEMMQTPCFYKNVKEKTHGGSRLPCLLHAAQWVLRPRLAQAVSTLATGTSTRPRPSPLQRRPA